MRRFTLLATLCLLAACDRNRSGAENAMRPLLKDPDSAKFGEFYFNANTQKGCLAVNGKNSLGGYTGEQQAYVQKTEHGWETQGVAPIPLESCRRVFADYKS